LNKVLIILLTLTWFQFKSKSQTDSIKLTDGRWAPYLSIKQTRQANAPLIIALHGYGMDENQMATLANPDFDFECHYLSLRAFCPLGKGEYAWFNISGSLDSLEYDKGEINKTMTLLTDFIEKVSKEYESSSIYLIGYSQGATLLFSYASQAHEHIKAMAAFSGVALYQTGSKVNALPFFIGHDQYDVLISKADIEASQEYLQRLGAKIEFHQYPVPHVIAAKGRRDLAAWLKSQIEK